MAIFDSQKVDYLWKKLGYGRSKTDVNSIKNATNESIASPLFLRGDVIWSQSNLIPSVIPGATTGVVQVYPSSSPIECTNDITASSNRTWKTGQIDWIPPEIGDTYLIKVYVHTSSDAANASSSGTQLFAAGSGNDDEWFFDYQSGTLNFIGDNLPNGVNFTGKSVYIVGARYTGIKGVSAPGSATNFTDVTISGDLDVDGHTDLDNVSISGVTTTSGLLDIDAGGQANTFKVEDLTDNRIVIAGTGGELEDDANLTFNGSTLSVGVDLDVDGQTELDHVNVSGVSTFAGAADFNGNVDIDGRTELDITNIAETLNVTGISTFASAVDINADLDVDGRTELDITNIAETLNVVGVSTFASNVDINADIDVDGHTNLDNVNVSGAATVSGKVDVDGGLEANTAIIEDLTDNRVVISGPGGELEDDANLTFDGSTLSVGVDLDVTGDLDVDGHTELDQLRVAGVSTFAGDVDISSGGNLTVAGNLIVDGTQTILNTTQLEVEDINIGIASADPKLSNAALDGAGITIHGADGDKTLTWNNANSRMEFNTDLHVPNITSTDLTLTGDLDVDGRTELDTTNISETLNVTGISTFDSAVDINADLDVDGRTELDITNISETLNVVGVSTFASSVDINSDLDVDGRSELDITNIAETLNVAGISTFASAVDINSDLDVDGHTDLDNVSISGVTTVAGTLDANGGLEANTAKVEDLTDNRVVIAGVGGELEDDANLTFNGSVLDLGVDLDVDGRTELDITNISETLNVSGISTFASNVDINADLDVDGRTELDITNVSDTLNVVGVSTFASSVDINADLDVDGHTDLDNVSISGVTTTSGLLDIDAGGQANTFKVEDLTDNRIVIAGSGGELEDDANLTFDGSTLAVGVDLNVTGDLDVDGHTNLDNVSVSGVTTFTGAIDANGDVDIDGHTNLDNVSISGVATVTGKLDANGGLEANTAIIEDLTDNRVVISGPGGELEDDANFTFNGTELSVGVNLDVDGRTELDITNIAETLNVVGVSTFASNVDINADLDVDGRSELDITNIAETLNVAGISTFASAVDINSDLDVDGTTELDVLNVAETATFSSNIDANGDLDVDGRTELDITNISETLNVSGISTFSSDVSVNAKLKLPDGSVSANYAGFGDDDDLKIFHNGSHSIIRETGAGSLYLQSDDNVILGKDSNTEIMVKGVADGAVELYYDNVKKFETTADGIDVTGHTELDDLNVSGVSTFASTVDINADLDVDGRTELDITNIAETLNVAGISTFASNVDINADIDVDGHTNLDNVSISGVATVTGKLDANGGLQANTAIIEDLTDNRVVISGPGGELEDDVNFTFNGTELSVGVDLDVDGRTELDITNISETLNVTGISTFDSAVDINADLDVDGRTELDITNISETLNVVGVSTFASNVDINSNLDVDGHTDLDNVSISGVTTTSGLLDIDAGGQANTFKVEDLTENRVVISGPGGELEDDANLTFDGSTLSVGVNLDVDGRTELDITNIAETLNVVGITTLGNTVVGGATTELVVNGDARITGILTIGTSSLTLDGDQNQVQVGSALTLGHTIGLQYHTQNLHADGFEVNNINVSGITTLSSLNFAGGTAVTAILDEDTLVSNRDDALATQQSIKAYVDSQVTAQDLDFGADSGTGSVDLDSQSLTISGTTNEIETSASNQTITIGLPDSVTITHDLTVLRDIEVTGNLTVNGTQTILNTSQLEVEDINIGIASADPKLSNAALDGAGITIHGAAGDKTLTWNNANSRMEFNTDLHVPNITSTDLTLTGDLDVDGLSELDDVNVSGAATVAGILDANGGLQANTAIIEDLTDNRVVIAGSGGELEDDANLTYDGVDLSTNSLIVTDLTDNRVLLAGTGGSVEDDANLTFNGTQLAVGVDLDVDGHTDLDNVSISGVTTTSGLLDIDAGGQANTFKVEDLTDNRVVIAGSGGELEDDANLTFDGSTLSVGVDLDVDGHTDLDNVSISGVTTTSGLLDIDAGGQANTFKVEDLTDNRIVIAGTGGELEDDANLTFNGTQLAVGVDLDVDGHTELDNLNVSGVSTFASTVDINADLDVDGHTDLDNVSISGVTTTSGLLDIDSGGQANTFKVEDLTDNRVVISGSGGELEDDANLTFDGSTLAVGVDLNVTGDLDVDGLAELDDVNVSGAATVAGTFDANGGLTANTAIIEDLTENRIVIAGTGGELEDDANLTFDGSTLSVGVDLDVDGTTELDVLNVAETATFSSNIDANGDLDVDGHTDLDNVSISGVTTTSGLLDIDAGGQANTFKVEDLTDNRVVIVGTGGELEDDANLTFNGSTLAVGVDLNVTGDLDVDGHTELDNLNVSGVTTFQSHVHLGDADVLRFGDNNDLEILHTGSSSTIRDLGPGQLYLQSNGGGVWITSSGANEKFAVFTDSSVDLYHSNVKKFETTNEGVLVSGGTTTGTLSVSGVSTFSGAIDANGDLDVDGQTELDHVNVSGVATITSAIITNTTFGSGTAITSVDTDLATVSSSDDTLASAKAIKTYIDNQVTAQDLDFGGDSGTGAIDLDSQSLTISGTTNEIETSASNQTITIGLPDDVTITSGLTVGSGITVTGISTFASDLDVNGGLDVDGHTDLDNVSISGVSTFVGVSTFQEDVNFELNGTGNYIRVDRSDRSLHLSDDTTLKFGTSPSDGGATKFTIKAQTHVLPALNNTYLENYDQGDVLLRNTVDDQDIAIQSDSGSGGGVVDYFRADGSTGEAILYHYGNQKLNTTSYGVGIAGSITVTNDLDVTGVSTFTGAIDANGDLDVDGHTELDNVNVSGASTFTGAADFNGDIDVDGHTELDNLNVSGVSTFAGAADFNGDVDVDGHTELDNLNVSGVSTFAGAADFNGDVDVDGTTELDVLNVAETATFSANIDANGDLDVDGHTDLDNVSISGVTTTSGLLDVDSGLTANTAIIEDLTDNRIVIAGSGGELEDDANLTYDGTDLSANSLIVTDLTDNRVLLAGSGGAVEDDSNLTFDGSTLTVAVDLDVDGRTELDITNIAETLNVVGVSTFASNVDINADLDVDGHTELDNVNISGVATATAFHTGAEGSAIRVSSDTISGPATLNIDPAAVGDNTGTVVIKGDLQVDGTQTIINSTTVTVNDLNIQVADGAANDAAADGAGITVNSGEGDKTFQFEATGDNFGSSEHLNLASGKRYKINNTGVLSANGLGSGVVNSSLTSVGTLVGLTVSGQTSLDNTEVTGISTFSSSVDINADLDVDGHTDLDNVSISGVTTTSGLLDIDAGGQANTFKVEDLTDNRIVIVGSGGELEDDSNLTFDGSTLTVGVGLDVDGHTELDNVNISGVATATSFVKSSNSGGFLKADGTEDTNTYLTSFTETNDLSSAVTWADVPDANITQSSVTQHQSALSITESQITDLQSYLTSYTETQTLNDVLALGNSSSTGLSVGVVTTTALKGFNYLQAPHGTTVTYSVTVASKTSAHRYNGSGSNSGYLIDGVESPFLTFTPGRTYRFTLSSSDMTSHPFRFYLEADKTTSYTTNVTSTSTYTEIVVTDTTPTVLHYQCSAHDYMGNAVQVNSNKIDTPYQIDGLKGANITGVTTATSFVKSSNSGGFLKADGTEDTSTYLTSFTETNDLSTAVTWANVPDANITESSVTQHQSALSITESQISDLQTYLTSYTETQTLNDVLALGNSSSTGLSVGVVTATTLNATTVKVGTAVTISAGIITATSLETTGDINSTTAVKVNGTSVIQSAVDEALALAIALG